MLELKPGSTAIGRNVGEAIPARERVTSLKGQMHDTKCVVFKEVPGVKIWGIEYKA